MIKAVGRQPVREEFLNNELGDKRLSKRLTHLAELMDGKFGSNIPHACGGWSEIVAAYRFFSNSHISPESIQMTHFLNTISRINDLKQDVVLVVQDTTSFNYKSHPATLALGVIGRFHGRKKSTKGIFCHSAMVYTSKGTPLGLLFQKFWLRRNTTKKVQKRRNRERWALPINKKESFRWIQPINVARIAQDQTHKRIILVHDSEGDISEVYRIAIENNIGFVVRADSVRICKESKPDSIKNYLKMAQCCDSMKVEIIYREKIPIHDFSCFRRLSPKRRKALIEIWWKEITIKMKDSFTGVSSEYKVNVVLAEEKLQPHIKVKEPLSWVLLTNESVSSNEDARKIIKYYQCRWQIEEYWRIYKTGCKVQECRLGYGSRLIKYLKIMGVVAWRQHYLTEIGREFSNLPASTCLNPFEIQSLQLKFKNTLNANLTLGEAWRLIAQLGGFQNRRRNKNPGPTTFWRGLQEIIYTAQGLEQAAEMSKQSSNRKFQAA